MVGILSTLAFLHSIQGSGHGPMIRFTGRDGGYDSGSLMEEQLAKTAYDPPNPQEFGFHCIAFTDPAVFAVYDRSYRPLRGMFAKIDLVNLLVQNGSNSVITISKLPYSLYDDIVENLDYALMEYTVTPLTTISIGLSMTTQFQLPRTSLSSSVSPTAPEDAITKKNAVFLVDNPMRRSDEHYQMIVGREFTYAKLPLVKIFAPRTWKYDEFSAKAKRANQLFDDWIQKETFNCNKKLFDYLERMNLWNDQAGLFRCKTFQDLAAQSPTAYQTLMTSITKTYAANGYNNEDAFRRDLSNSTIQSTMTFTIQIALDNGKIVTVPYP